MKDRPLAAGKTANAAAALTRFGTPLALILIILGLVTAVPPGPVRNLCASLVVLSVLFNIAMLYFIMQLSQYGQAIARVRMAFNLVFNVLLVYLMGDYWPPAWLLLSLTPIATAIYGTQMETIAAALGTSILLVIIYAVRSSMSGLAPLELNAQIAYGIYIFFLSLIVHHIVKDARSATR